MVNDFFPPRLPASPTIYAFAGTHPDHAGLLKKVGYTERVAADRIAEQFPSGVNPYRILAPRQSETLVDSRARFILTRIKYNIIPPTTQFINKMSHMLFLRGSMSVLFTAPSAPTS